MKNLELNKMGLAPVTEIEMQETDGGFLPLLIIGCVLLVGCVQNNQNNGGTQTNTQVNAQNTGDSATIKNNATLKVSPK